MSSDTCFAYVYRLKRQAMRAAPLMRHSWKFHYVFDERIRLAGCAKRKGSILYEGKPLYVRLLCPLCGDVRDYFRDGKLHPLCDDCATRAPCVLCGEPGRTSFDGSGVSLCYTCVVAEDAARRPPCSRCGATTLAEAETRCQPSGDDCPGELIAWPDASR